MNWIDIKGFEGKYQINENGEVKRLPFSIIQHSVSGKEYIRNFKGGIVKQWKDSNGYKMVALEGENYRIHYLLFNTFIGDSTGYFIDHIDRNKLNNSLSNLRLVDAVESNYNRTLPYKPSIVDMGKYYKYKKMSKPFQLTFQEHGKRMYIGYYKTYEEAENKYRELYEEREKRNKVC